MHSTNAPNAQLLAMADDLTGATILNNAGLANALVARGLPYVVGRLCLSNSDPFPPIQGNREDEQRGHDWYWKRDGGYPLRNYVEQLDKRVIVQVANEQNHPDDSWFYIGVMKAAAADGRKVVIFNDSVGNPWDSDSKNGFGTWRRRIDSGCLRLCKQLGMFVGYHGYGKPDSFPGSAPDDDGAWKLYGGRVLEAYAITPEDSRPDILYTECGTFKADYMGVDFTLSDLRGYQERLRNTPVMALMYWESGGRGDPTFERSCLDPALDAIAALMRAQ